MSSAKIIGIETGAEDEEKAQESFSEFLGEGGGSCNLRRQEAGGITRVAC